MCDHKPRLLLRLFLAVLVVCAAVVSGAAVVSAHEAEVAVPAQASNEPAPGFDGLEDLYDDVYGGYVPCGDNDFFNHSPRGTDVLPINRWGGATSGYHTRLGAKFTDDIAQRLSRDVVAPVGLVVGNSMWQMSAGLMDFATNFAIVDTLGCEADKTAAGIGAALSPALVVVMALSVLAFLWQRWRGGAGGGQGGWKAITKPLLILCLFAVMLSGANSTVASINNPNRESVAGTGSPKWIVDSVDRLAAEVINPITEALGNPQLTSPAGGEGYSCADYIEVLHGLYKARNSSSRNSMVPLIMSRMWEQSGLQVWAAGQFGLKNNYGDYVYCHLLERNVRVDLGTQRDLLSAAYGVPVSGETPAPKVLVGGSNTEVDQRTIMLAQCQWTGSGWTVRPGWDRVDRGGTDGDRATGEDCKDGWESDESHPGVFNYEDKPNYIAESTTAAPEVADFLYNFHGDASSTAISTAVLYAVASLIMLLVMGGLALSVILAKLAVIVLILFTFVMLLASMIPGNEGKEAKYFKYLAGAVVYSYLLTLILSLVVIITQWIVDAGVAQFNAGSFMAILTMTFAPITAVVIVNMVAKNFLGAPSLLKPTGGLAFAAAMGGAGAGVGIGADRMLRRARGTAERNAIRGGRAGKERAKSLLGGEGKGKKAKDRKHGFETNAQEGRGKGAAVTAGAGAATGAAAEAAGAGAAAKGAAKNLTGAERTAAAKQQRDANKWVREGRGQYADKSYMQRRMLGTRDRVMDSINRGAGAVVSKVAARAESFEAGVQELRANPVRKGLAAAGKGLAYGGAALAAGPAASAGVPVVAAYGVYKANQARKNLANRSESALQKPSANERRLDEYRSHMQKQEAISASQTEPEIVGRIDASASRWDTAGDVPDEIRARQAESYDAAQSQRGRTTSGFDRGGD